MFKIKRYGVITLSLLIGWVSGWSEENGRIGKPKSILVDPRISTAESLVRTKDGTKESVIPTPDEIKMIELVNAARQDPASVGWGSYPAVPPLEPNIELWEAARFHSQEMIDSGYFSHDSRDADSVVYETWDERLVRFGYSGWSTMGENIAGNPTVNGAFNAWLNSEGHRNNIFRSTFSEHGIGIITGGPYGKMFTHNFGDRFGISFDLTVSATDISFTPENPKVGDIVEVTAVIHNANKTHAFPVLVHFFDGDPGAGGKFIDEDSIEAIIDGYGGQEVSIINWNTSGKDPGSHDIWVKVDPNNHFSETNEGNNTAYKSIVLQEAGVEISEESTVGFSLNIKSPSYNREIEITYCLDSPAYCLMRIYNSCGQLVNTFVNERKDAGSYKIYWDKRNKDRSRITPGVYFCRLVCDKNAITKKIIVVQ